MLLQDPSQQLGFDEKYAITSICHEALAEVPRGPLAWFGGRDIVIGPRVGPELKDISVGDSDSGDNSTAILDKQLALDDGRAIQYLSLRHVLGRTGIPLITVDASPRTVG